MGDYLIMLYALFPQFRSSTNLSFANAPFVIHFLLRIGTLLHRASQVLEGIYQLNFSLALMTLGNFAVGNIAVGNFAVGNFAVRKFHRRKFRHSDISPYGNLKKNHCMKNSSYICFTIN